MLPVLDSNNALEQQYLDYLDALNRAGFDGDIETQYSSRLAMATDNSIYQKLPQAIVYPKHIDDLVCIGRTVQAFDEVVFSARGGGTGTNGQSLTHGIVVDLSRHMNQILEINADEQWVKVQAGVVKDALNDALKPFGYFFAPDLSTSNRATIGGMINTDASGQGSLKYGKTSDHVLGITAVLANGSYLNTELTYDEQPEPIQSVLGVTAGVCRQNRQKIEEKFPPLNRFLTGYDLKRILQHYNQGEHLYIDYVQTKHDAKG